MAVDDLWVSKRTGERTPRYGVGKRYRVRVQGHPSRSFALLKPAQAWERRLLSEVPRKRVDVTVDQLVGLWLDGKRHLSPKGLEAATGAAKHVRAEWGPLHPGDVRAHEAQAWLSGQGWSASLQHKVAQALAGSLAIGVAMGALDTNPAEQLKVAKEVRREAVFLSVAQVRELADAAGDSAPMVWLLATTGLRVGECIALDVGDVDTRRRRLRVHRAKSGRGRDVPVPASVLAMLPLKGRGRGEPLFTGPRGRLVHRSWSRSAFEPARAAIGMPELHVHDLRHTAASLAIASGATVKDVQSMLGHASAAMTLDLYAGHFDATLDDVATRMDGLLDVTSPDATLRVPAQGDVI